MESRDGFRWRRGGRGDGSWHRICRPDRRGGRCHDGERSFDAAEIGLFRVILLELQSGNCLMVVAEL